MFHSDCEKERESMKDFGNFMSFILINIQEEKTCKSIRNSWNLCNRYNETLKNIENLRVIFCLLIINVE